MIYCQNGCTLISTALPSDQSATSESKGLILN